jgi:diadenosine tetraphosphatase ApaH/serine/threonine PP2A family protein phosphatase
VRIVIVSDVHSNVVALDAVLDALRPFDAVWHLGDAVGYGPHPVEAIERLAAVQAVSVMGNHDAAVLGTISTDWFNDDARAAIEWTAERLTPAARHWLQVLPEAVDEGDFTLVHGSPREPLFEYLMSRAAARPNIESLETPHGLVGHSHIPLAFSQEEGAELDVTMGLDGTAVELDGRRVIANPGSVGQPRDGDYRAAALVLDRDAGTLTWQRVEYDIDAVQAAMRAAKLPKRLIDRLSRGR